MVTRFMCIKRLHEDGEHASPMHCESVAAIDYDALAAELEEAKKSFISGAYISQGAHIASLEAENAKMRAEYPYLAECLRLQARVAVLEAAIGKCNGELGCVAYAALAPPTGEG